MIQQKAYNLTESQVNQIKIERGIFTKLFKYLEFKGALYSVPHSATMEEWDEWKARVKKAHPIQYAIREFIEDIEYSLHRKWRSLCYLIKTFFCPENATIRKAVPKRYSDITSIILDVNFAAIVQFKKEADASCVDWKAQDSHAEFKKWLDESYSWITEGKANLEKEKDRVYPEIDVADMLKSINTEKYKDLYKEVDRIDALIEQTDENILIQMIKYRNYFWT